MFQLRHHCRMVKYMSQNAFLQGRRILFLPGGLRTGRPMDVTNLYFNPFYLFFEAIKPVVFTPTRHVYSPEYRTDLLGVCSKRSRTGQVVAKTMKMPMISIH